MKRLAGYLIAVLMVVACGSDRQTFLLKGTFKGFNQGELYIYGINGTHRLDTIAVVKGSFSYEVPLEEPVMFALVFPNLSELPVYGEAGAEVEVNGDASHLRETAISGTKANQEMTAFRRQTIQQTPQELNKSAAAYIEEHPESPFSLYLLNKHFTQVARPDYEQAARLAALVQKAQPDNPALKGLAGKLQGLGRLKDGGRLPAFTVTDISGKAVKSADLNARLNLITTWAKWNYESTNIQRQLANVQRRHGDKLKVLSICMDADVRECRRSVERDSVKWSTVCDGRMWETPVLEKLGLAYVPDNILTDGQGKIIAHGLRWNELQKKIDELLTDKAD